MNNKTKTMHKVGLPVLLIGLALAGDVAAQAELNESRLAAPQTRIQTCGQVDIAWNLELVNQYPRIQQACHEVVINNGRKWARFEAEFVRVNNDGSVTSDFIGPLGRSMGRYTLIPGPDQTVSLSGRDYPFSALTPKQRINLYVPEGASGLASSTSAPVEQYSRVRSYEDVVIKEDYVAQNAPAPMPIYNRLPDTAGPLPWLAIGGIASLLGGLGLRFGRTLSRKQ